MQTIKVMANNKGFDYALVINPKAIQRVNSQILNSVVTEFCEVHFTNGSSVFVKSSLADLQDKIDEALLADGT